MSGRQRAPDQDAERRCVLRLMPWQVRLNCITGIFWPGFTSEARGFEAWASAERERLHQLALGGHRRLAAHYLERGH